MSWLTYPHVGNHIPLLNLNFVLKYVQKNIVQHFLRTKNKPNHSVEIGHVFHYDNYKIKKPKCIKDNVDWKTASSLSHP